MRTAVRLITAAGLNAGYEPTAPIHTMHFQGGDATVFCRDESRLLFRFTHEFILKQVGREWEVSSAGYIYQFMPHDDRHKILVAFHWHTDANSPVSYPHVQVDTQFLPPRLHGTHIPTGRVSIESVVRFAIDELHVVCRQQGERWRRDLERNEQEFWRKRRWGSSPGESMGSSA